MTFGAAFIFREIDWLPQWMADAARVAQLVLACVLILVILYSISGKPGGRRPTWLIVGWLVPGEIWSWRVLLSGVERWGEPLWYGGTPVTLTMQALVLAGWYLRWRREIHANVQQAVSVLARR